MMINYLLLVNVFDVHVWLSFVLSMYWRLKM